MTDATVRVYDFDTGRAYAIPAGELAPGMAKVSIDGIAGEVWVDAAELAPGPIRHRALPADVADRVERVFATFEQVLTVQDVDLPTFTDDFRREIDPAAEVAAWEYLAWVYERITGLSDFSLAGKCGVYNTLLACSTGPRHAARATIEAPALTLPQREAVMDLYYLGAGLLAA